MKIHFGTGNDSAEDYYYMTIGDLRASQLTTACASAAARTTGRVPTWTPPTPSTCPAPTASSPEPTPASLACEVHAMMVEPPGTLYGWVTDVNTGDSIDHRGGARSTPGPVLDQHHGALEFASALTTTNYERRVASPLTAPRSSPSRPWAAHVTSASTQRGLRRIHFHRHWRLRAPTHYHEHHQRPSDQQQLRVSAPGSTPRWPRQAPAGLTVTAYARASTARRPPAPSLGVSNFTGASTLSISSYTPSPAGPPACWTPARYGRTTTGYEFEASDQTRVTATSCGSSHADLRRRHHRLRIRIRRELRPRLGGSGVVTNATGSAVLGDIGVMDPATDADPDRKLDLGHRQTGKAAVINSPNRQPSGPWQGLDTAIDQQGHHGSCRPRRHLQNRLGEHHHQPVQNPGREPASGRVPHQRRGRGHLR